MSWAAQCKEWDEIKDEMIAKGSPPSAYDVSQEQRRRMAARGEKPMEYEDILDELRSSGVHRIGAKSSA